MRNKKIINKSEGPLWRISTKVRNTDVGTYTKTRKIKKSLLAGIKKTYIWTRGYLRSVGWVFLLGLVCVLMFLMFTTPFFQLKSDKIELILEPEPVFDRTAITSILRDFAGDNIFSISTEEIFGKLTENIRHIASVEKTLKFPDGMRIRIRSFPPSYRAYIGEDVFLLTDNGQLIPDIPEVETTSLTINHLVQDANIGKKTPILVEDMRAIGQTLNAWKKNLPNVKIDSLIYYDQEKEFHIVSSGTRIITGLDRGPEEIVILADLLKRSALKLGVHNYIDLRVPNRVYTCPKSEKLCAANIASIYE